METHIPKVTFPKSFQKPRFVGLQDNVLIKNKNTVWVAAEEGCCWNYVDWESLEVGKLEE